MITDQSLVQKDLISESHSVPYGGKGAAFGGRSTTKERPGADYLLPVSSPCELQLARFFFFVCFLS